MPSPSTTAPAAGAAAFPATGRYSSLGAPVPGGSAVAATQVTRLVDTRWARRAADRATAASLSSPSLGAACSIAGMGSPYGLSGSSLQNPPAGYAGGGDGYPMYDLGASGAVVGAARDSLLASAATLGIVAGLQSVAGGYAEAQANAASAGFLLIEAAIGAPDAQTAVNCLRLASQVASAVANAGPLFAGVIQLVAAGLIGAGSSIIGKVLSGALGALQQQIGTGIANVLRGIPPELVALGAESAALAGLCLAATGSQCILPTGAGVGQFAALYPGGPAAPGGALPLGQAMAALDAAAIAAVNSQLAKALGLPAAQQYAAPQGYPSPQTAPRTQYLQIVDGIPPIQMQPGGQVVDPATAVVASLLASLLALFGSGSPLGGLGSPGTYPSGSLGSSGLFAPGGQGLGSGSSFGTFAGAAAAAIALGAIPPTVGDLQEAGFAASSGDAQYSVPGPDGAAVLTPAGDPAGAAALMGLMLADGCSFGTALGSSLSLAAQGVLLSGAVTPGALATLEALQETLQCRKAGLTDCYRGAYAASRLSEARWGLMLGTCGILGVYPELVPGLCPAGTGPLGTCN